MLNLCEDLDLEDLSQHRTLNNTVKSSGRQLFSNIIYDPNMYNQYLEISFIQIKMLGE